MQIWTLSLALFTVSYGFSAQAATTFFPNLHFHDVRAYVTGYNTVPGQTDDTPCIAASGANICGRTDAVACPRHIPLGTYVTIRGQFYVCEDRLAKKFDRRFDISCDKDMSCPGQVTGWVDIKVSSENLCRLSPAVAQAQPAASTRSSAVVLRAKAWGARRRAWFGRA